MKSLLFGVVIVVVDYADDSNYYYYYYCNYNHKCMTVIICYFFSPDTPSSQTSHSLLLLLLLIRPSYLDYSVLLCCTGVYFSVSVTTAAVMKDWSQRKHASAEDLDIFHLFPEIQFPLFHRRTSICSEFPVNQASHAINLPCSGTRKNGHCIHISLRHFLAWLGLFDWSPSHMSSAARYV